MTEQASEPRPGSPLTPESLRARLEAVRSEIAEACRRAGRDPSGVRLVAITKGHPPGIAAMALAAGIEDLGENYAQDLAVKQSAAPGARWHFVGRLQSNKAAAIAVADVVHSLEPGRGADRLAREGRRRGRPVAGLVQVDFTGRRQGVSPEDLAGSLRSLRETDGLAIEGLMTVAPLGPTPEAARPYFRRLRQLRDELGPDLPELSMGMSADLRVAVEEGATMVRVGTALFGARDPERDDDKG